MVDAIHDLPERSEMAPAQLYSTESGRLFHSGKIAIATVGLPARGKTYVCTRPEMIDAADSLFRQPYISCAGSLFEMVNKHQYSLIRVITMAHRVSDVRLGVKTRVFHLGDYRRATVGPGQDVPHDYFFVNGEEISDLGNCEVSADALGDGAFGS